MSKFAAIKKKIKTHLFIICPNNSGSTYLKNVLATCCNTWNLHREGQNTFGFIGPCNTNKMGIPPLLWAANRRFRQMRKDPSLYNWEKNRKAWYLQAFSKSESASVFVEKSPPFLLLVPFLMTNFENTKFLLMVRNPYAMAEGILRRHKGKNKLELIADHIIACFQYQIRNLQFLKDQSHLFFTYEELCSMPDDIEIKIKKLVPELSDLRLKQTIPVKGIYNETLRNMNREQIERLSDMQKKELKTRFLKYESFFKHFGYYISSDL